MNFTYKDISYKILAEKLSICILNLWEHRKINDNDIKEIFKFVCSGKYGIQTIDETDLEHIDILISELEDAGCPEKFIDLYYNVKISMMYNHIDNIKNLFKSHISENKLNNIIAKLRENIDTLEKEYDKFITAKT